MENPMSAALPDNALTRDTHQWTAADFFSAYRYWALFIALFLIVWAGGSFWPYIQIALRASEALNSQILLPLFRSFFAAQNWGWAIGSLLAVATLRRGAWPMLVTLMVLSAASMAAIFLALYTLESERALAAAVSLLIGFYGLMLGALKAAFLVIAAGSLVSGHPRKTDFAFAFCLLLAPTVFGATLGSLSGVALAAWLQDIDMPALACGIFAAVFAGMLLILIPARRFAFDERPRVRHAPQARPPAPVSAWVPVVMGFTVLAALAGIFIVAGLYQFRYWGRSTPWELIPLTLFLLGSSVYVVFWFYRIHKQLAAMISSQCLLAPAAAIVFILLAPLGMALTLLMLRDALDDHAAKAGNNTASTPISAWFIVWVLFLFPIAMGMIQNRANKIRQIGIARQDGICHAALPVNSSEMAG